MTCDAAAGEKCQDYEDRPAECVCRVGFLEEDDGNCTGACCTRMHSSRMRTGRSLTVCCSLLPGGGGLVQGGSARGGCLVRGGSAPGGGVSAPRGVPGPGGGAWCRGGIPACTDADTPPPVDRHTLVKTLPWPNFVAAGKYP